MRPGAPRSTPYSVTRRLQLMLETPSSPGASWKWGVCGLLLLATMLNYMDRQTLAQTAKTIKQESGLSNEQYGNLEFGFGLAFATGGFFIRFIVAWGHARGFVS